MPKLKGSTDSSLSFDEMFAGKGRIRSSYRRFADWLHAHSDEDMRARREEAAQLFHRMGITFSVYGDSTGRERLIPFDTIPRIISQEEWTYLERGLRQRAQALNAFLDDIYHEKNIIQAGILPASTLLNHPHYQPCMQGLRLPHGIHAHIAGIDIVRHGDGRYFVLEDNLRTPSGVSYMLENRKMMMRLFPELFIHQPVAPIHHYPDLLHQVLCDAAPNASGKPTVVVLTPGRYNSAYFEHAFLAQQMGVELVEGADLVVRDHKVYMRTTGGLEKVDVIYRRIDDEYLDPTVFRQDSMLGTPGLVSAYLAGQVGIVNAVGNGFADDKSIYPYVPEMTRFYLNEEPLLNNVPTYACRDPESLAYTLDHLAELVVKEVNGSGGYGMLVGPAASSRELTEFRHKLERNPESYIAQPTLALSTCPTYVDEGIAPRHIDLRPFVLSGADIHIVPGGLTRVALREGSLVVNSSQGGGTKDTWILDAHRTEGR